LTEIDTPVYLASIARKTPILLTGCGFITDRALETELKENNKEAIV